MPIVNYEMLIWHSDTSVRLFTVVPSRFHHAAVATGSCAYNCVVQVLIDAIHCTTGCEMNRVFFQISV